MRIKPVAPEPVGNFHVPEVDRVGSVGFSGYGAAANDLVSGVRSNVCTLQESGRARCVRSLGAGAGLEAAEVDGGATPESAAIGVGVCPAATGCGAWGSRMSESSSVPPHPVVSIKVGVDGTVEVDGEVVQRDGSHDAYSVAVHAAAVRVAQPLGRPVRAIAADADGRTELIVHPDGRATDIRSVPSPAETSTHRAPAAEGPADDLDAMFRQASGDGAGTPPEDPVTPPRGGGRGWPLMAVGVAVALFLVLGGVALMMWPTGDEESPEGAPVEDSAPAPASPGPEQKQDPETLLVTARALGDGLVKFLIAAPGAGEVEIRVDPARGRSKGQILTMGGLDVDETLFAGLAGGTATWTVERPGAPAVKGRTTVLPEPGRDDPQNRPERRGAREGR